MSVSPEDKIVRGADLATIGSQVKAKLAEKQDLLISGTDIKTINNESLLGPGNLQVAASGKFKGFYISTQALSSAFPNPEAGDFAYVKTNETPATAYIYSVVSGDWQDTGIEVTISDIESVFSIQAKFALLSTLKKVAWVDGNGQSYIDTLRNRLLGSIEVESITAVFDSGDDWVLDTMSIEVLRQYLVVTATLSDESEEVVSDYDIAGSMTAGEQTFVVSYLDVTTSFTATITHNIAATLYGSTWTFYAGTSGAIGTQSNGVVRLKCGTSSDVTNWGTWGADVKKTLWSAVNGMTVKVRVKVNAIDANYGVFQLGIYQNSSIQSLANQYCKKMSLTTTDWVAASDGYYEQTKVLDISNFTQGDLTPGTNSTFGILCYARSTTNIQEIYDVQIIDITE